MDNNSDFLIGIRLEMPSIGFGLKSYACWVLTCFHDLLLQNKLPQIQSFIVVGKSTPNFSDL